MEEMMLKSGGPPMRIECETGPTRVWCTWWTWNSDRVVRVWGSEFDRRCLRPYDPNPTIVPDHIIDEDDDDGEAWKRGTSPA